MKKMLDGSLLSSSLKENIKSEVSFLQERKGIEPHLIVITTINNEDYEQTIEPLRLAAYEVGLSTELIEIPVDYSLEMLKDLINELNEMREITGIVVRIPNIDFIKWQEIIQLIHPDKDVEGLHPSNFWRFGYKVSSNVPCLAMSVLTILKDEGISLKGKHLVVIGDQKPLLTPISLLKETNVTICEPQTSNLESLMGQADILIRISNKELIPMELPNPSTIAFEISQEYLTQINHLMIFSNSLKRMK